MQLVINTYGAYLSRRGELFRVKVKEKIDSKNFGVSEGNKVMNRAFYGE